MAEMNLHGMNPIVREYVENIIGQQCVRCHIGKDRSFFLGFGEVIRIKSVIGEADHGKWEIGTYHNAWRIVRGGKIMCGMQDTVESIDELRQTMNQIEWGRCSAIRQLSSFDVRVEFDNDIFVDILAATSDEDEMLHIFCPDKIVIIFSVVDGWVAGRSDEPWK